MTGGNFRPKGTGPPGRRMTATLYDLIAAVNDSIEPGEEKLVADVVIDILRRKRAKYNRREPGARGTPADAMTSVPIEGYSTPDSENTVILLPLVRQCGD